MTTDEFHTYWRDVHAPLLADDPALRRHVRRFELNHRLPEDYARDAYRPEGAGAGFDGVAVQWFESFDAFVESLGVPAVERDVNPDTAYFLDMSTIEFVMAGPPTVVIGD